MTNSTKHDTLSTAILVLGVTQGAAPFVAKPLGWTPLWCLPRHLPAPGWWVVAGAVVILALAGLVVVERSKERHGTQRR